MLVQHTDHTTTVPAFFYLAAIGLAGLALVVMGLFEFPTYDDGGTFLLLLVLATVAQVATTTVTLGDGSITYALSPAVSLAAVPFFSPLAAAVIDAGTAFSLWVIKPPRTQDDLSHWRQLAFNIGASGIAMVVAGTLFLTTRRWLGADTLLGQLVPWLVAAVVVDQLHQFLRLTMLRLEYGREIKPLDLWRQELSASQVSIVVMALGGGILAYAIDHYGNLGVIIFFLPVLLSAVAFRLYVNQMQSHLAGLEEMVNTRTRELSALNREKDAFLAVLTHDMKTPLTSIGLYAHLIRKSPAMVLKKPEMTDIIMRSQRSLLDIVNNIVDLENLQSGGEIPRHAEEFNVAPLLELTVESVRTQADEKRQALTISLGSTDLKLRGDRQHIERIFLNLLSNAVKYTGEEGTIDVRANRQEKHIVIEVEDNGYGIPDDELPHIFDRYRRVNKHRERAVGTGLGLAITRALVEGHGGRITVKSEEGVGSCFAVHLPIAVADTSR